jgi:transcription initiation factor TFIID subunit 13
MLLSKNLGQSKKPSRKMGCCNFWHDTPRETQTNIVISNRHIKYNPFEKITSFCRCGIDGIFGQTHFVPERLLPRSLPLFEPFYNGLECMEAKTVAKPTPKTVTEGKKSRLFSKELRQMMYGFGDVRDPLPESVELMEDMVMDFINDIVTKAMQINKQRSRLTTEDIVFLIRKDKKKYTRAMELLQINEEVKMAKRAIEDFDESKESID